MYIFRHCSKSLHNDRHHFKPTYPGTDDLFNFFKKLSIPITLFTILVGDAQIASIGLCEAGLHVVDGLIIREILIGKRSEWSRL